MISNPKVTLILPVYNVELYLETCLKSILNQTYKNLEIIAVNDGSTDSSLSILDSYSRMDNRLRIINQENSGLSAARNRGLYQPEKGKYIYFVDSDDFLENNMIEKMVNLSEKYSLDMIRFDAQNFIDGEDVKEQVNGRDKLTIKQINKSFSIYDRDSFIKKSWYYAIPTVWCYFFKTELIEKDGGLRFEDGILHEDTLFIPLLLHRVSTIGYLKKTFYFRRIRPLSIMTSPDRKDDHFSSIVYVLEKLNLFSNSLNQNETIFKKYIETYKAKAFLLLNEYSTDYNKTNRILQRNLEIKIPLFQKILYFRRKFL